MPVDTRILETVGHRSRDGAPCDRGKILIVDDEESILRLFKIIIQAALPDQDIDLAVNGAEAVKAFEQSHHAVLLMDLHMPVMDGQEAFFRVENLCDERGWEMPSVVFITGFAPSNTLRSLVEKSDEHCLLPKPVAGETLVDVVAERLQ